MAVNRRIVKIILEEARSVEDRCKGYRDELMSAIGEILEYERQHRTKGTNIQLRINEKCDATGRFLAEHRSQSGGSR
jgi:hypothetical protein